MSWTNNISKILASLFVIANLAITLDYNPAAQTYPNSYHTEQLAPQAPVAHQSISFDKAKKLLQLDDPLRHSSSTDYSKRILLEQIETTLRLSVQNLGSQAIKPLLLKIVLNDIIQQKSHWI